MKLGRNERCPCGSGLKVKRCCGVDALRERVQVAEELFDLARHFPRYRPATAAFDRWAASVLDEPSDEALAAGREALGDEERSRIVDGFAAEYPDIWRGILENFGNDELAREIVLNGAVVAGLLERGPLLEFPLALLDAEPGEPPADALALVLDGRDLWSVIESGETAETLDALPDELGYDDYERAWNAALATAAERRATPWHEERLDVLLARVRERLPDDDYPVASARLLDACDRLDARERRRLAADLLADSLERVYAAA